ncbi:MAG: hypothetical protein HC845_06000 [Akkermansiaceae bacterium]|nr:hypothetical protein [Akkermansiaceae bacterium]
MEKAQAASEKATTEEKAMLWRRVIEIGGSRAPARAFRNLADAYIALGDFRSAEAVVRQGHQFHPKDASLEERFGRIAFAEGFSEKAVQLWMQLIERYPEVNCAWIYRKIGTALSSEGLMHRAEKVLKEGLEKYPNDELMIKAHAKALTLANASAVITEASEAKSLLGNIKIGTLSLPIMLDESNQHLLEILGFEKCIAPLNDLVSAEEVDIFGNWGDENRKANRFARQLATEKNKPLLFIDYGFITSSSDFYIP